MMQNQEQYLKISRRDLDALLQMRNGEAALLYLYLRQSGCRERRQAGRALFMTRQQLDDAFERLELAGLLPLTAEAPAEPGGEIASSVRSAAPSDFSVGGQNASEGASSDFISSAVSVFPSTSGAKNPSPLPEPGEPADNYSAADVVSRTKSDEAFAAILEEAGLIIGRQLSSPELCRMLAVYDHYEFPPEVFMMLMHHVADVYREKYAGRRRPGVRSFEKESAMWAEYEITDFDAAERFIHRYRERFSLAGDIKAAMGITDRDFSDTERRYIDRWLDWGFRPDVIHLAYDKTITNKRKFNIGYMNGILQKWHESGLHSLKEVLGKDRVSPKASSGSSPSATVNPAEILQLIDTL